MGWDYMIAFLKREAGEGAELVEFYLYTEGLRVVSKKRHRFR